MEIIRDERVEKAFQRAWDRDELAHLLAGENGYYLDNGRNEWALPQCFSYVMDFGFRNYWFLHECTAEVPRRFHSALEELMDHQSIGLADCCITSWLICYCVRRNEAIQSPDETSRQMFEIDLDLFGSRYRQWLMNHREVLIREERYRGDAKNQWEVTLRALKRIRGMGAPDLVPHNEHRT